MANPSPRPTYRTIAAEAGVSHATVSMALRNHPSIPETTRERIRKIAASQGYRADPNIGKLMHHLRTRRHTHISSNLVALRLEPATKGSYPARVLAGTLEQAQALGYSLEVINLDEPPVSAKRLDKILRSRGVEGLVLLPMRPVNLSDRLNWAGFSVVATSHSILDPHFNTVVPNQFSNMIKLCDRIVSTGESRIGIITTNAHDLSVNHRFTLAYYWHTQTKGAPHIPPFLATGTEVERTSLMDWIETHDPRVIATDSADMLRSLQERLPGAIHQRIKWVCTGLESEETGRYGIIENPEEVGRAALDVLAGMVMRGERGIPKYRRCTEIDGVVVLPQEKNPQMARCAKRTS